MALKRIFKFRNLWIGIAMLWIMLFHSGFYIESSLFSFIKKFGYGGVDICLFASGVGCYYSLERQPDIFQFLKRRACRLGPVYLCFIIPWMFWKNSVIALPARAILGNLLGIQTLVTWQYHFNWYIGGLVIFYFLIPYLKSMTDSFSKPRQDLLAGMGLILLSLPFWYFNGEIVILSRLPVLYAGIVCAKMAKQEYALKAMDFLILLATAAAGTVALLIFDRYLPDLLWSCGLYWYPFALIVPGFCIFLSILAEKLENRRVFHGIHHLLGIVGTYSFEVYLLHVFLYESIVPQIKPHVAFIPNNLLWFLTLPVIAAGSFLLNRISAALVRIYRNQTTKAKA